MKDKSRKNLSFADQLKLALGGLNNDHKQQNTNGNQLNIKEIKINKTSVQKLH